jgi:hypothetical protein
MLKKLLGASAALALGLLIGMAGETLADTTTLLGVFNIDNVPPTFTINGAYGKNGVNNGTAGSAINTLQAAVPTLTSCGTGTPSVSATSTDTDGVITLGGGSPTACTLNFAAAHTNAAGTSEIPVCVANAGSGAGVASVTAISPTAVTFTLSATTTTLYYVCMQ